MQISTPPSGPLPSNVQQRVPTIQRQLQNRPTRQQLEDQRIVKNGVSAKRDQLMRAQVKDSLKHGLAKRRSIREVFQKGVFESRDETKANYKEFKGLALSEFLKSRPTVQHLVDNRLIEDTLTWSTFTQLGMVPEKRNCHCSCTVGNNLYVFGGYGISNDAFLNIRVLSLENNTWSIPSCAVAGLFPRNRYSSTCVCLGQRIIIFGGFSPEGYWLNDLHVLDTQSEDQRFTHMWYQPETSGNPPCPRAAHSCTVVGRKLFFFGGNDGASLFDDLYILDTETFHWTKVTNPRGTKPAARSGHSALLVKDKIVVFGGGGAGGKPMSDVHYLNTRKMSWSQPNLIGTGPSARAGHTAVVLHKTNVLIFGGGYIDKVCNDVHILNVERGQWSRPADTGDVPCARTGHSMNAVKSRIFVFGGCDSSGMMYNDLYLLDATFFRTQLGGIYSPKVVHSPAFNNSTDSLDMSDVQTDISVEEQTYFTSMLDNTGAHLVTLLDKVEDNIKNRQGEMKLNQQRMIAQVKMYHQQYEDAFKDLRTEVEDVKNLILTELSHLRVSLSGFLSSNSPRHARNFEPPQVAPAPAGLQKRRSLQPQKPGVHPMMIEQTPSARVRVSQEEEVKSDGASEEHGSGMDVNLSKGDSFLKVPPAGDYMSRPDSNSDNELEGAFFCDDAFGADAGVNDDTDDASSVSSASDMSEASVGSPAKEKYKASTALADLIARDMKEGDLDPPKKKRRRRRKKKKKATSPQNGNYVFNSSTQIPSHV